MSAMSAAHDMLNIHNNDDLNIIKIMLLIEVCIFCHPSLILQYKGIFCLLKLAGTIRNFAGPTDFHSW